MEMPGELRRIRQHQELCVSFDVAQFKRNVIFEKSVTVVYIEKFRKILSNFHMLKDSRNSNMQANRVRPTNPFTRFKKEDIEQSIPSRFERMVDKYPDRLAVKTNNQEFTYRELNQISNQVAHAILAQRGEGEEPIALLLGYGALTIAAILGVLKAGKTYVPIDPRIPWSRKRFILEDLEKCVRKRLNSIFQRWSKGKRLKWM